MPVHGESGTYWIKERGWIQTTLADVSVMWILLGILLGMTREFAVVKYYLAVSNRRGLLGSGLSLVIGLLDLLVVGKMAIDRNFFMAGGYILGESAGTYLSIRIGK